jgi:diaminopimelate epimerase
MTPKDIQQRTRNLITRFTREYARLPEQTVVGIVRQAMRDNPHVSVKEIRVALTRQAAPERAAVAAAWSKFKERG